MTENWLHRVVLIAALLSISWLGMMLLHEVGHVMGALITGGTVQRVVWHPLVMSRTDVNPNPMPLGVVWAGPLTGTALPVMLAGLARIARSRITYLVEFFAGFCLITNGAYIGSGVFLQFGDTHVMHVLGTPRWVMAAFGLLTIPPGLWWWHRVSPRLGFGNSPTRIPAEHVWGTAVAALLLLLVGLILGVRGI